VRISVPDLKKNRAPFFARALQIGKTVEGEIVLLIIQGFVHQEKIEGGSLIVVCASTGLDELYADLNLKEQQLQATIKEMVCNANKASHNLVRSRTLRRGKQQDNRDVSFQNAEVFWLDFPGPISRHDVPIRSVKPASWGGSTRTGKRIL
jgi:hypothetical protein